MTNTTKRIAHPNCTPGHHRVVALIHVTDTHPEHAGDLDGTLLLPLDFPDQPTTWTEQLRCELRAERRMIELHEAGMTATMQWVGR